MDFNTRVCFQTVGIYFCKQKQTSYWGGWGNLVPKDLYRILGIFQGDFLPVVAFCGWYEGEYTTFSFQHTAQASRTMPKDLPHTGPFATIKPTHHTLSVSISQLRYSLSIHWTQSSPDLWGRGGKGKKKEKCLKDKGAQLSGLKEQYFILHIWSQLRSRNTHLCQNKLLNFSGCDLAANAMVAQSSSNPCLKNKNLQRWRHQLPTKEFCLWVHLTA